MYQALVEFTILLGFGSILLLFGIILLANPLLLWKWDKKWLKRYKKYKKANPPNTYKIRQQMGALITIGFGVTLLVGALFTTLIYQA